MFLCLSKKLMSNLSDCGVNLYLFNLKLTIKQDFKINELKSTKYITI